jgi:hypothetical protein
MEEVEAEQEDTKPHPVVLERLGKDLREEPARHPRLRTTREVEEEVEGVQDPTQ